MAADFEADELLAKQLQAEFDKEEEKLQVGHKNNKSQSASDSDSDVTVEPDTPEWERNASPELLDLDCEMKTNRTSQQKQKSVSVNVNSNSLTTKLSKRHSKTHDLSDSGEDDTEEYLTNSDSKLKKSSVSEKMLKKESFKTSDKSIVSPEKKLSISHNISESEEEDVTTKSSDTSTPGLKRKQTLILEEDEEIEDNLNTNAKSKKKLMPCKFGSKCYRKNPSHFKEFSHSDESKPSTSKEERPATTPPPRKRARTDSGSRSVKRSPFEVYKHAQPLSFFLTKVSGIPAEYNNSYEMDLKDILSPGMGNLKASCQFNYMFEIPWLMKQYPESFRSKPLMLVHGFQGPNKAALQAEASSYSSIRFCQARLEMAYGTHHTKMMLLLYDDGMRVVIHTANLIERDWFQKTQGIWISPLFPKLKVPGSKTAGDSTTRFKHDLLEYVSAYKAYQLKEWIDHISNHDMSSARVYIIGSVPGRHTGETKHKFGHMRLRKVLNENGPPKDQTKAWPVIGQFSSIGSLGADKQKWLCTEWLQSLATVKGSSSVPLASVNLQLIFPTKDNVRTSLEGYPAGGSIPYSIHVAKKQPYLHTFFHHWKSTFRGRNRAMPHIKTYGRPSPSSKELGWFLVTSANLSKAAWGGLEKNGSQLMIRSYEIGVLFVPSCFGNKTTFSVTKSMYEMDKNTFPLPYDLPLKPYEKGDKPWIWDISYKDLPDSNGNMWCPS